MLKLHLSFFLLGTSLGLGPCLASCGILLIPYIGATVKNALKSSLVYLLFSCGRIIAYILSGILIFRAGELFLNWFNIDFNRYLYWFSGIFITLIGILLLFGKKLHNGVYCHLRGLFLERDRKTSFIFGLLIGLLPCAPLLSVLTYAALISKNIFQVSYFALSFGLGTAFSPLFAAILFSGFLVHLASKKEWLVRQLNFYCGIIIVLLGLNIFRKGF